METISIKDRDNDILLYLDDNSIRCYACYNTNVLDYLKLFKLSSDYSYIGKYNEYDIVLDNVSGLKHYINNNKENYELLFLNNGEYNIRYKSSNNKKSRNKIFRINGVIFCISCIGIILINGILIKTNGHRMDSYVEFDNYEINDIKNMIYSSNNLNSEEKEFLYNEDFLTDVLGTINDSNYLKYMYSIYFDNIDISKENEDFNDEDNIYGYYDFSTPSTIYVKHYEELDSFNKDIISHEFVHLCQETSGYNLITETCAEIITCEYYDSCRLNSYLNEVKVVKKLMEIIGSDVIWDYCFKGDFSVIESRVKPYLSSEEYNEFLNDLTIDYNNEEINLEKMNSLNNILSILYKNMYNDDIENNNIISMIESGDKKLNRYYFNSRKESFYYDETNGEYKDISYKEAIDEGIITINTMYKEPITIEEAYELIEKHNRHLYREIDHDSHDIKIEGSSVGLHGYFLTAEIDGVRYENVNIDDLVKEGIIKVNYYLTDNKKLTYEEYVNKDYKEGSFVMIMKDISTTLDENSVHTYVYDKVVLPNANELYYSRSSNSLTLYKRI